jgi:hypothetical protein
MAHICRKFFDLMDAYQSPIATEAVDRIAKLYQIEKEIRGRPPKERRLARDTRARPLLQTMRIWLEASLRQLTPKSETASAIHYARARWDAPVRYLDVSVRYSAHIVGQQPGISQCVPTLIGNSAGLKTM